MPGTSSVTLYRLGAVVTVQHVRKSAPTKTPQFGISIARQFNDISGYFSHSSSNTFLAIACRQSPSRCEIPYTILPDPCLGNILCAINGERRAGDQPASSPARNTTRRPISSGSLRRPIGIVGRILFSRTSFGTAAGFERRHVPFVYRDAGLGLEFRRRLVVAAIIRDDIVTGRLERFGNCRADTACSPRHQRVRGMFVLPVAWAVYYLSFWSSLRMRMTETRLSIS